MAKKKVVKKASELDQFLEFINKEPIKAPYGVTKQIGDYMFVFKVRKKQ